MTVNMLEEILKQFKEQGWRDKKVVIRNEKDHKLMYHIALIGITEKEAVIYIDYVYDDPEENK